MEYRIALKNGKWGYGKTAYEAVVKAVGTKKADLISDQIPTHFRLNGYSKTVYAKNGNEIGYLEIRA